MANLQKVLNVETLFKDQEVIKVLNFFRNKWRFLDRDELESHFHIAMINAVKNHNPERRQFKTTLSKYITWEITRAKPNRRINYKSNDFNILQKRQVDVAEKSIQLYNRVSEWMQKYLSEKERNVIILRIFQNMSWQEIADEIESDERSVRNCFSNGLSQLRYISKVEGIKLCDELDLA